MKRIWEGVKVFVVGLRRFVASTLGCLATVYVISRVSGVYMGLSPNGSANAPDGPLNLPVSAELITIAAWATGGWLGCTTATRQFRRRWPAIIEAPILALLALLSLLESHAGWAMAVSAAAVLVAGAGAFATYRPDPPEPEPGLLADVDPEPPLNAA